MDHTALDQGMFWVGALFVFTPIIFAGIVLGVWWHGRKQENQAHEESGPSPSQPVS
ncbi:MAG: hypothetical protein HY700_13710 [Gemmatimonadetes bacterium]|nr:hypothetical protein [Gemmatimonadota bacterium]